MGEKKNLSFLRGGRYYYNGAIDLKGDFGYYWESKVIVDVYPYAHYLNFYSTHLDSRSYNNKGFGMLIRCVVKA